MENKFSIHFNIFGVGKTIDNWLEEESEHEEEVVAAGSEATLLLVAAAGKEAALLPTASQVLDSHYRELTDAELLEIEEGALEVGTKKVTAFGLRVFMDWVQHTNKTTNLDTCSSDELNDILRRFYASVRTALGKPYSVSTMQGLKASLNRHFTGFNLYTDKAFETSNNVFKSIMKSYPKAGQDKATHHAFIAETDLHNLCSSPALSPDGTLLQRASCS